MIVSVHQPQYLPWLGYFDKIAKSDAFVFLDLVQYKHREFQNRNKIRTQMGWMWLTIPIQTKGKGRQKICEVKIDNESPWQRQHLQSLKTWYGKAPYFKEYLAHLEDFYRKPHDSFCEFAVGMIKTILTLLKINTTLYFESQLKTTKKRTERIIEICQKLNADTYLSGQGGKDYLEENKFFKARIKLVYQNFKHPVYKQLYTRSVNDFIPQLSVIDLLFNEGPNSRKILGLE